MLAYSAFRSVFRFGSDSMSVFFCVVCTHAAFLIKKQKALRDFQIMFYRWIIFASFVPGFNLVQIGRVCHGPFVWAGPGRADLKMVTGRAGPGRLGDAGSMTSLPWFVPWTEGPVQLREVGPDTGHFLTESCSDVPFHICRCRNGDDDLSLIHI